MSAILFLILLVKTKGLKKKIRKKNRSNKLTLLTSCIKSQIAALRAKVKMNRKNIQSIIPGKIRR